MSQTSRRLHPRQIRRLAVRFWRETEDRPRKGFTKNVSLTGAFVSTPDPAGRGERLRLELSDAGRTALLHAVVVHAHRVPPELRRFADSAMGLRFLGLDEVVGPFLGKEALQPEAAREPSGRGASSAGGSSPPATGEGLAGGGTSTHRIGAERGASGAGGPVPIYALSFASADDFLTVYRRDMANGGLFVTAERPARLDERVAVDLRLPGAGAPTVRVEGRVVQVVEPRQLASGRTAGGIGLELIDPDGVLLRLAPHVDAYER